MNAGDDQELVLHIFAAGSEIDQTIGQQTGTAIAATSEDEVDNAELDDPDYNDFGGSSNDTSDGILGDDSDGTNSTSGDDYGDDSDSDSDSQIAAALGALSASATPSQVALSASATPSAGSAAVVKTSGTFSYLGCELDSSASRTLSSLQWSGTGLTVERCAAYCATYQYMGVEFGSQ